MHVKGIHHITAISSDAQETYNFYTKVLGLRLVKKSVNQDDIQTYHLFFGNKYGSPGMDLTFFPFKNVIQGRRGAGLVTVISLAVPINSLLFWKKRFEELHIKHDVISEQFGHKRLTLYDNDDQCLELVEIKEVESEYEQNIWTTNEINKHSAIRCFHSATLHVPSLESIKPVLDTFGYIQTHKEHTTYEYRIGKRKGTSHLIIEEKPLAHRAVNGAGTVHHIAFIVKDRKEQEALRAEIINIGLKPTYVIDRYYFTSVYFRTEAGILFEIATEQPGFTADEDAKTLGEKLALPPFLEEHREYIQSVLPPLITR